MSDGGWQDGKASGSAPGPSLPATPPPLTRVQSDARRGRNWAMLVVLASLALLFYALAFVKLGGH